MPKTHTPLHLKNFEILEPKVTYKQVYNELKELSEWLKTNQNDFYKNNFTMLIEKVIDSNEEIKGSVSYAGRKLKIEPNIKTSYQPYNYAEMFRASIVSKIAGYLQNDLLLEVIISFDEDVKKIKANDVIKKFKLDYPNFKVPKFNFVVKTLDRLSRLGSLHNVPKGDGILYYWATDTHFSKLTVNGKYIYFTYKSEIINGPITLKFKLPSNERFIVGVDDKVSRPNVRFDKNDTLWFDFTVQKKVDNAVNFDGMGFLCVDLGIVETFTGSIIGPDYHSSPFYTNHYANSLSKKIDRLWINYKSNFDKAVFCESNGFVDKSKVLFLEARRIRSKISRLKLELARSIAEQIVGVAELYGVGVCFEDLGWVPNSSWEQSLQQKTVGDLAVRKRVFVRKVNASKTSQLCIYCRSEVKHNSVTRMSVCSSCCFKLDRDVLASRNIGLKVFHLNSFTSIQTRVSRPRLKSWFKPNLPHNKLSKNSKLYSKIR